MINAFVINNRSVLQRLIWLLLIILLLSGCASPWAKVNSVHPHPTFVSAGKPTDNKATLLIPRTVRRARVNGVMLPIVWQNEFKTGNWRMWELLPSEYLIECEYNSKVYGKMNLSGKFMAENGKSYALFTYETVRKVGESYGQTEWYEYKYHGTYIVELPDDFDDSGIQGWELPPWEEYIYFKRVTRLR